MATKLQIWQTVQKEVMDLMEHYEIEDKISKELLTILETNIAPKKSGGGSIINAPKEIDGIMHYFCRFHQKYEVGSDMVMSKGKSKGYCKASISLWNKTNSNIKKLNERLAEEVQAGNFDKAKELSDEAKELKEIFNKPEFYDYDRDWAKFRGVETIEDD